MGASALRSQDVLLLCKLLVMDHPEAAKQKDLALSLGLNQSEVSTGFARLASASLIDQDSKVPIKIEAFRFLENAVQYVFPPEFGEFTVGMVTSIFAEPLKKEFFEKGAMPLVWPDALGKTKGMTLLPIHESVPEACKSDPKLYELISVLDALRSKKSPRIREVSEKVIRKLVFGAGNEF